MTPLARAAAAAYVIALLLLAAVGAASQLRYRTQAELLDAKERAIIDLASGRAAAASVNGPLAVTTWARTAGMVPAPEAARVEAVAPGLVPPTPATPLAPRLEIVTVWR